MCPISVRQNLILTDSDICHLSDVRICQNEILEFRDVPYLKTTVSTSRLIISEHIFEKCILTLAKSQKRVSWCQRVSDQKVGFLKKFKNGVLDHILGPHDLTHPSSPFWWPIMAYFNSFVAILDILPAN